jgi:hypothetical protein
MQHPKMAVVQLKMGRNWVDCMPARRKLLDVDCTL